MDKVVITKYDGGPFVIEGEFEIRDGKGEVFAKQTSVALCRCGQSTSQPFCDGSHRPACFAENSEAR